MLLFCISRSTDSLSQLSDLDAAIQAIAENPFITRDLARKIARDTDNDDEKKKEFANKHYSYLLWDLYQIYNRVPREIALTLSLVRIDPAKLATLTPDALTKYGLSTTEAEQAIAAVLA